MVVPLPFQTRALILSSHHRRSWDPNDGWWQADFSGVYEETNAYVQATDHVKLLQTMSDAEIAKLALEGIFTIEEFANAADDVMKRLQSFHVHDFPEVCWHKGKLLWAALQLLFFSHITIM